MPELPEVETVVTSLRPRLVGRTIVEVKVFLPKIIKLCTPAEFTSRLQGQQILEIHRRGKYIIITISGGWWLVGHLRMTGRLTRVGEKIPRDKHTHVVFRLDDRSELKYADMRQFGCLYLIRPQDVAQITGLATLGPEPLAGDLTPEQFARGFKGRKLKVKQLLLDQQFIAGIGNIYADEILFAAGINPNRKADSLTQEEIFNIFHKMRQVLELGIAHRGTSVKDYVDGSGLKGEFQNYLKVYGRTNQACFTCGTTLIKEKIGGRSSHYCPNCQR